MTPITVRKAWKKAPIQSLSFSDIVAFAQDKQDCLFKDIERFLSLKNELPGRASLPYEQIVEGWNYYDSFRNTFTPYPTPQGILQLLDCETIQHNEKHRTPFCAFAYILHHDYSLGVYAWLGDGEVSLIPCEIDLTIEVGVYDAIYLSNFYELHGKARYLDLLALANTQYKFTDDQVQAMRGMGHYGARLPWMDLGCYVDAEDGKGPSEYLSLARLYKFLFNETHAKDVRSDIVKATWEEGCEKKVEFLSYNYSDILATFKCFNLIFKRCCKTIPHAFSWLGMLEESSTLYRMEDDFNLWLDKCDSQYDKIKKEYVDKLKRLAVVYAKTAPFEEWDDGLDWKYREEKAKDFECFFQEGAPEEWNRVFKSGQYKGCEKWVKKANDSKYIIDWLLKSWLLVNVPLCLTYRLRCAYAQPIWLIDWFKQLAVGQGITSLPTYLVCRATYEGQRVYRDYVDVKGRDFYRLCVSGVPLPDPSTNEEKGAVGLFGSGYDLWYKLGILTSPTRDLEYLRELYESLNHWGKLRDRLHKLVIRQIDGGLWLKPDVGLAAAVSGRQSSKLWHLMPKITKGNKSIGIEYAQKVVAPEGHYTLAADFDSQELRGQALISDLAHGRIESNEFSKAVYVGSKEKGTDPHSVMSKKQGIKRDSAKNLIYGAGYLGGVDRLASLVYTNLDSETFKGKTLMGALNELKVQAKSFLSDYRGQKRGDRYIGGLASDYYNKTIELANRPSPQSLVLGVLHQKHLDSRYCGNQFLTTRVNINVQRMGVDFMQIYLSAVRILSEHLSIPMHLNMCIHDNFLFYVPKEHYEKARDIMQTAHVFTWCFALKAMGFQEIPEEILFFESVDVDVRYRKYPSDPCITLSNPGFPAFLCEAQT